MNERGVHTVDVIKSRSGVTVYSAFHDKNGGVIREKEPQTRCSFGELREDFAKELHLSQSLDGLYKAATNIAGLAEAYMAVRTVVDLINNMDSEMPRDILATVVLFGIIAVGFISSSVQEENIRQTSNEMEALEIAQEIKSPHFRREFPH